MSSNLKNRNLLSLDELSQSEIEFLLETAHELKCAKNAGTERPQLQGKNFALLFENASTRTRSAFEVAAQDQGGKVSVIGPVDSQPGAKQNLKDTARVLGRLYDAIECRGVEQALAAELAQYAGVPVYSDLADPFHPTQILADYMTMQEQHPAKPLSQMRLAYLGNARDNVGNSLLQGAALMGMDLRIGAPRALWPPQAWIDASRAKAKKSGARLHFTESAEEAVREVDFIYTAAWISKDDLESDWVERIAQCKPYQVHAGLMRASGNPSAKILRCLPSLHDRSLRKGGDIFRKLGVDGLEISDEVFASPACVARQQAENRLHTIKALLVATVA